MAEDQDPTPETGDEEPTTDETPEGSDALGDAGKKALDAMKAGRLLARKERDAAKAEATAAKAELAKLKGEKAPEVDEKAIRETARKEAQAEVLRDRVLDRIEAKAAKLFADPEDARALLAAKADDYIDDGQIDSDAIVKALADLLKKKPHLGAQGGKRFEGSADGGARKGSNAPAQLTEQDLKRMTPHQIDAARLAGKLDDLLGASS
jgi:hypothetical protein